MDASITLDVQSLTVHVDTNAIVVAYVRFVFREHGLSTTLLRCVVTSVIYPISTAHQ